MLDGEAKTVTACVCAVVLPAEAANNKLVGLTESCASCAEATPASAAIRMTIAAARAAEPALRRNAEENILVTICFLPCPTILVYPKTEKFSSPFARKAGARAIFPPLTDCSGLIGSD
jgi:hypothetical protein